MKIKLQQKNGLIYTSVDLFCANIKLDNLKVDFREIDPYERVNGLLGLDFLRKAGIILDLADCVMYKK
ncbi:hypothetical protein [Clostridium cellulovorans]|uniref:hypothetical protein n=1 Tax=Clostridium cellulovorans TaxID=1493 RepID=UPI0001A975BB|nr:hypothetical protein [Clostridium cellulovorans]